MKKTFLILFIPLFLLITVLSSIKYFVFPRLEIFIKNEIVQYLYTETHQPITIERVHVQAFLPKMSLYNIEASSTPSLKIKIPEMTFHLDLFALMVGRLQVALINLKNPEIEFHPPPLTKESSPSAPSFPIATTLPIEKVFETLKQIPILNFSVENLKLYVDHLPHESSLHLEAANLYIKNKKDRLFLTARLPQIVWSQNQNKNLNLNAFLNFNLTAQTFTLENFKVNTQGAALSISGSQDNPENLLKNTNLNLKLNLNINFENITNNLNSILEFPIKPKGVLEFESALNFKSFQNMTGKTSLKTQGVKIDQFTIGDAAIKGNFTENTLNLSEITLEHPSGNVILNDTLLHLKKGFPFKSQVNIKALDLQKLFQSLNLKKIPVYMNLSGDLPCEGDFFDGFDLACQGSLQAQNFKVSTSVNEKISSRIVEINQFSAKGSLNVNSQGVDYEAVVEMPKSQIKTHGKILYSQGFTINYNSESLNLKDISYLTGLDLSGNVAIDGETSGDSTDATIDAKIKTTDFQIDKYFLGNFSTTMSFNSPVLYFKEIQGQLFNSHYSSDLELDLRKSHILGTFNSSNMELFAVQRILKGLYNFPAELNGSGPMTLSFEGPLDFWKLNYNVDATFRSILINNEYFEKLKVKASSQEGNLTLNEAFLQKNKSLLTASGRILNTQALDLFFNGQGFQIEESQFINKLSSNIFGTLSFNSTLKGTIQQPDFFFTGNVKNTVLKDRSYEDSYFLIKADTEELRLEASLFGKKLATKILQQSKLSPRLKISTQIQDWDYTKLLSLLGNETLFDQYQGLLTFNAELESETGDYNQLSGQMNIDRFSLQRNNELIESQGTASALFKNGHISLDHFILEGKNSNFTLTGSDFSLLNLNLNLKGKSDLKMVQLFFPFLDDIGGRFLLSVGFAGAWNQPEMLGNLNFEHAFFKIRKFPHPIEKVDASISFSQKNIIFNSIHGQIAGGTLQGDGNILLKDIGVFPTNIRAHLDNMTLLVPEGVRSSGSANISITGDWFPFLLSGTYDVKEGLISKNFDQDVASTEKTVDLIYLPKVVRQSSFDPLVLDLKVLLPRNMIIKNSNVDGAVYGNLQVKGPPDHPQLIGKITAEKNMKLLFRDRIFNVINGTVEFKNSDDLNPEVFLNAQSRIDEYDVNLNVQGPVNNLQIQMSSAPPLPEKEIIPLLAFGVTSSKLDQNIASKTQTEKLGYELGQYIYRSNPLLRKKIKDTFGLDVDIRSDFDSTTNTNVNKVTASKKLTEKISVNASRTIGGPSTFYDAEVTYRINSNLSTLGKWKTQEATETQNIQGNTAAKSDLFGVDLEFKREFK